MKATLDSFKTRRTGELAGCRATVYSLPAFAQSAGVDIAALPYSKRVLLENLLRHEDGETVSAEDILALARNDGAATEEVELAYHPARVLMPDSSGVPLLADLASMRDRVAELTGRPELVNPRIPVDIVVDHSVSADFSGRADALAKNMALEFQRNDERYRFLRWAQGAFTGLRIVPPGNGIVHQVNLELLAEVVRFSGEGADRTAFPDSLVGMDSHTPMINAMGIMGWGVGGIEAGSAMLGEPISMLIPRIVGCRLTGRARPGVTATDVVLHLTEVLRRHGVVGKFVEYFGDGLDAMPLADRATVANMAPEYGATMGFFPVDEQTMRYLRATGRPAGQVARVEAYARYQHLWRTDAAPVYDELVEVDLARVGRSLSGPARPEQRVDLPRVPKQFGEAFPAREEGRAGPGGGEGEPDGVAGRPGAAGVANGRIENGHVVIAAITSCTNTSNPRVMLAAGLLARNAVRAGLKVQPWVKTSLSPGSRRVTDYFRKAGLDGALDTLGFQVVGYGCMTCMGGSGDLLPDVAEQITERGVAAVAVLSGNRNFEARVHRSVRANYLASPALVVAYALAGTILRDLDSEPLGQDSHGKPVFLADIWPSDEEVDALVQEVVQPTLFTEGYRHVFEGDALWKALDGQGDPRFRWDPKSTYIRRAPYADAMATQVDANVDVRQARVLALLGDNITTDHISPVGSTSPESAVGRYLIERGVAPRDFNLLLTRRANPDVVVRTAFANVRLRNRLCPDAEGGYTLLLPEGTEMDIFSAAMQYRDRGEAMVIIAGKNYGSGSSRDTAAKGTALLGVRAVIAESFERIHRSNLVGMGVLPLQFPDGTGPATLGLTGHERVDFRVAGELAPRAPVECRFFGEDGTCQEVSLTLRIDTPRELRWVQAGGILPFVGNELLASAKSVSDAR